VRVRSFEPGDIAWAESLLGGLGGRLQARRNEVVDVLDASGFVAEHDGQPIGLLTYAGRSDGTELLYVEVTTKQHGVGTALLQALVGLVGTKQRIWVVTTNDNLDALRFYQRRGFAVRDVRVGGADRARETVKPSIPLVGDYGIPIRDEIELELKRYV
jgi:GNAT superfamily N-acetyltransferase